MRENKGPCRKCRLRNLIIILTALILICVGLVLFIYKKLPQKTKIEPLPTQAPAATITQSVEPTKEQIMAQFFNISAKEWNESATGVKTKLATDQKTIALTFDACGGTSGNGYDEKLIQYLESEQIPATLFVSGRWAEANQEIFKKLAQNPLFEIENHGQNHKPCSASGQSAYKIEGTKNAGEIYDEIENASQTLEKYGGPITKFYRAGTGFTDEICPQIAARLGLQVVNYNLVGDAGGTYSAKQVEDALLKAESGSIVIMHFNHPESGTAEGLIKAIPELKNRGYKFVKLQDFELK